MSRFSGVIWIFNLVGFLGLKLIIGSGLEGFENLNLRSAYFE